MEDTTDEDNGILFGDEEVEQGQDEEAMDHQPAHHGHCIEAQFLSNSCGVIHLQDLASNEEHNPEGEVPGVGGTEQPALVLARRGSQVTVALLHCQA